MTRLWDNRRVLVCVGTGGVGKTTVSATIALAAAASGRRTLVMTIDPARRLANALGLEDLGKGDHEISADVLKPFGIPLQGELHVMMPDVKSTFDDLVQRWAPDPARADKILNNRIYQHFSTALAGSHEYAAVEKLYEVYTAGNYDLIVLDTPPSQNAIDFLEAPGRIIDFLDNDAVGWLMRPTLLAGKMSLRLLDLGGNIIFKALGRLAGGDTLRELSEFLLGFQGMYDGFRDRSRRVKNLLASPELAFVQITAPMPAQEAAMLRFRQDLAASNLQVRGLVVNRVRPLAVTPEQQKLLDVRLGELAKDWPAPMAAAIATAISEESALASRDQDMVRKLCAQSSDMPCYTLPELPRDAHDLASLVSLHKTFL